MSLSGTENNQAAASSRVAAAKRIGGGFDKMGECVCVVSSLAVDAAAVGKAVATGSSGRPPVPGVKPL